MMRATKLLLLILFMLSFFSCTNHYKIIDSTQLQNAFILNSSATFKGYYYQGTDKEFHYFISKWDFTKDNYFKLKKEDLNINIPYRFGEQELRIDLFKTNKNFGSNEFYELYIVK